MISRSPKRCRHGVVRTKGPIVRVSNSTSLRVMFMAAPHRADWCQNSLTRHPCGKVRNTSNSWEATKRGRGIRQHATYSILLESSTVNTGEPARDGKEGGE